MGKRLHCTNNGGIGHTLHSVELSLASWEEVGGGGGGGGGRWRGLREGCVALCRGFLEVKNASCDHCLGLLVTVSGSVILP